jgi:hypothetical protein
MTSISKMSNVSKSKETQAAVKTPQELVHIKHKISLRQYKYWLLMIRAYRENYELKTPVSEKGFHRISISTLEDALGYELVLKELKDDLEAIRVEPIIYNVLGKDGKQVQRGAGFISEWGIASNWIEFKLPSFLEQSIRQLDLKTSIFQKINWQVFNAFSGKYEAILYKLCRDYAGVGFTPTMSILQYREYMGLKETEYAEFKDLNKFIISNPIKRINENGASDIEIEAIFTRSMRKIVSVQFKVKLSEQTMFDFSDDPAFRHSKIVITIEQQKYYLSLKDSISIENSIQRANEYAKKKEDGGHPCNYGALYRTAIRDDWGVNFVDKRKAEGELVEKKNAKDNAVISEFKEEQRQDFMRIQTAQAVKNLSNDDRHDYVKKYIEEFGQEKATTYKPSSVEFTDKVEAVNFTIWLKKIVAPEFDQEKFTAWLATQKH